MTTTTASEKIPWYTKLAFGSGDLGPAIVTAISGFFLLNFLINVAGLDPGPAGTLLSLALDPYPRSPAADARLAELAAAEDEAAAAAGNPFAALRTLRPRPH